MAADIPIHPPNLLEEATVNVYVGPEKRHFVVPRKLLCSHSIYCDRLLNGYFAEASGNSVYLEDDEPEAFDLLIQWMLHGSLALDNLETTVFADPNGQKALGEGCHLLCALYCLCDRIQVVKIGEEILEKLRALVRHGNNFPLQPRTVRMVLKNVLESSILHGYILQEVADDLINELGHDYDYYDELLEGPEAIEGLVKALFTRMKNKGYDWSRHQGRSWNLVPANKTGR